VVARLIERLREAILCYQVGGHCASIWGIIDGEADITTASNLQSNNSPYSRVSLIVSVVCPDPFLKASFDAHLKLQEVIHCSVLVGVHTDN